MILLSLIEWTVSNSVQRKNIFIISIAEGLTRLSLETLCNGLQFTETNTFEGISERHEILVQLGSALQRRSDFFGKSSVKRPGNLMGKIK